jgi:hypothetical protein
MKMWCDKMNLSRNKTEVQKPEITKKGQFLTVNR